MRLSLVDVSVFILGNGKNYGIKINYCEQKKPSGIPEAFILGKKFINNDSNSILYKTYSSLLNDLKKLSSDLINEKCKDNFLKIYKKKSMSFKKGWWSEI